jgi:hypothetical protein
VGDRRGRARLWNERMPERELAEIAYHCQISRRIRSSLGRIVILTE